MLTVGDYFGKHPVLLVIIACLSIATLFSVLLNNCLMQTTRLVSFMASLKPAF
jgi:hypothetical protein